MLQSCFSLEQDRDMVWMSAPEQRCSRVGLGTGLESLSDMERDLEKK